MTSKKYHRCNGQKCRELARRRRRRAPLKLAAGWLTIGYLKPSKTQFAVAASVQCVL